MNTDIEIEIKSEPVIKTEKEEIKNTTEIGLNNRMDYEEKEEEDEDDPIEKEIDVYISKSLANNIYVLQYPIRDISKNYDSSNYLGARIKPKLNKLELDLELDTHTKNYSKTKGEQICLNVDGKHTYTVPTSKQNAKEQKYFNSNLMDKIVYSSTNATLGQMNRLYFLSVLKDKKLHLTPIRSILQMKPSFEYYDIYEKKVKDLREGSKSAELTDYSTEDETENEDKAELVTLKYSSQANLNQSNNQEQEQNWMNVSFLNLNNPESYSYKNMLYCRDQDKYIKLEYSQEDFISRLVDINSLSSTN